MRGVGEEYQDVEEMVEKLGPKGTAEGFLKAREYFEANNKDPEAKPMTAGEWRKVLDEDAAQDWGEGGEEEAPWMEGEEEEYGEQDYAEEGEEEYAEGEGEGEGDEPASKKARTEE